MRLGAGTVVRGTLPDPAVAHALAVRGQLACPALSVRSTAATVAQETQ
ncbi:hypothetical protein ACFP81_11080 [Deinococcus lacus]|uniref:Uncharacterized protein n=1 Tax=Deinococcus lacus TaxID=392561 RepID=A0ABW1YDU4_9DEIO